MFNQPSQNLCGDISFFIRSHRKDGRFLNREEWMFSPEKLTKCELIRCRGKINPADLIFQRVPTGNRIKGLDSIHL